MKKLFFVLALFIGLIACNKKDDQTMDFKKKPVNYAIISPTTDPLVMTIGEVQQLTTTDPELYTNWYVIDQQIAYIYWDGRVEARATGVTVVSAFHYQQQGQPLQDNLVVIVE